MSYYNTSGTFSNLVKLKENKDQPLDTVQCIINDPYWLP